MRLLFGGSVRLDSFTATLQSTSCPQGGAQPANLLSANFDGDPLTGPEVLRVYADSLCWDVAPTAGARATTWLSGFGTDGATETRR